VILADGLRWQTIFEAVVNEEVIEKLVVVVSIVFMAHNH
jgi:hypothetical protein